MQWRYQGKALKEPGTRAHKDWETKIKMTKQIKPKYKNKKLKMPPRERYDERQEQKKWHKNNIKMAWRQNRPRKQNKNGKNEKQIQK